jgi:hypothetical protein
MSGTDRGESSIRTPSRTGHRIGNAFLFAFFLGASIALGGAVYSSRVVEDLWSSSPPASLRQWAPAMNAAGANFWSKITPLTGLLAILTLATAFSTSPAHRRWRIAGSVLFVLVAISSVAYFAPTIGRLSPPALDALSAGEASAMARRWTALDSLRMLGVAGAWGCTLRAITLR